jgi:gliding motility-associated-like protein
MCLFFGILQYRKPLESKIKYYVRFVCLVIILSTNHVVLGQLAANFTASVTSGCAPVLVRFSDNSAGNPTTWNWDLGNGTISTQKDPVTTYQTSGFYTVSLTVSNGTVSNTIVRSQYISIFDKPIVNFRASDSFNCIPFTTSFTDLSSAAVGTITSWLWNFDDGSSSTLQNPQHLYNQPGNYNITLQVTTSGGCTNSLSKLSYIRANDSIRALFGFSKPVQCKPPETIRFTNNTTGPGTLSYTWNYGNGSTANGFAPSCTYLSGGLYTVTLIAKNNFGCADTVVLKDTVRIREVQSRIEGPDTVCAEKTVSYSSGTAPVPLSTIWKFSDGSSAFGTSVTQNWPLPGTYPVKLISNFSTCSDSVTKQITVTAAPEFSFVANDSAACKAPLPVTFTDLSQNSVAWKWYFGDGDSSTIQNPAHTYTREGTFTVRLTVTNSGGCTRTVTKPGYIKILKPIAIFNVGNDEGGCIPYTCQPVSLSYAPDGIAGYLWNFGGGNTSTSPSPSHLFPDEGTFPVSLIIRSRDGCTDTTTVPVKTGTPPFVNFGATPRIVCPGVDVKFTDSSAPADRWLWNFGEGGTSITANPVHQFFDTLPRSVKLTVWNNGCSDSLQKNVFIRVLPGLARFRPVYNCTNKREVYFKDSSISPQSWFWDFGDGTTSTLQNPTHQFAAFQSYNVSLTTTNDTCSNTKTIVVKLINEIPDFSASMRAVCRYQPVSFYLDNFNKANITGYLWDFGDGATSTEGDSVLHAYSSSGFYTVTLTITDIYGCSETVAKTNFIQVSVPQAGFSINGGGGCLNKVVNFVDTSFAETGNNNIAQWSWDFGDGSTQSYTVPPPSPVTHIYRNTGSYYPSLIITDSIGCSDTAFNIQPISINQPLASFFAANFNTCTADTVLFRNPSSGSRLTYLWSLGDNNFSTDSLPVKQYTSNGDYTIKLVVTDEVGCKDSMTRSNYIRVRDVTASFRVNDSTGNCTPFKVNFTNTSLNSISQVWTFGDGGLSSTLSPSYTYSNPGTFTAILTSRRSGNCFSRDSVKIRISAPTGSLSYAPLEGCAPLAANFVASSSEKVNFTWDFNDGVSATTADSLIVHTYTSPGTFVPSVLLSDSSGCVISVIGKDSVKLYSSRVNFGTAANTYCFGVPVQFTDSTISGSNVTAYRWEFGDGSVSLLRNPVHIYNSTGLYTVKLFIVTQYGCSDSLVKSNYLKVVTQPRAAITGNAPTYCGASAISLQGSLLNTDTSAIKWHWNFGNGNNSGLQNPSPQEYKDTGQYSIQLIASNSSGCADTTITSIRIQPIPEVFAGNDTAICTGNPTQLQASGADTYTWQPAAFLSCSNCSNPVTTIPNDGYYFVRGTNIFGCEKTDSIFIDVKKPFTLTGLKTADSVCAGNSLQLNVTGAENYSWSPVQGLTNAFINNPIATPAANITYTVTGFDSSNCFSDSARIFIKVNPLPLVNAGADLSSIFGRPVSLAPQYSADIVSWLWQPATALSCNTCPNPVANPENDITYKITVTNGSGCTAEDQIMLQVKCDKSAVFLPSAFTPNNDQWNQVFYPLHAPGYSRVKISSFKIYDRFGHPVFQSGNFYSNDKTAGWDGRLNGRDCAVGSYIYTLEMVCGNNQVVSFSGNILLLR